MGLLPTPFYRDVPCAVVGLNGLSSRSGDRLALQLPKSLVPRRRYARVIVSEHRWGIMLDVQHEEPFKHAMPGRHAWQTEGTHFLAGGQGVRVRRYECRFSRLIGPEAVIARLERYLRSRQDFQVQPLVRVTPEGLQLILPVVDPRGLGERFHADHPVEHEVLTAYNHGAYAAGGPVTNIAPNCRCTIKETEDMRKIDTTTAETVPAALVVGQAVVRCTFDDGGKEYGYFAGGIELKEGDAVVVASPYGEGPNSNRGTFDEACGGYLKVVRVSSVEPNVDAIERAAKWIIGKVDTAEYVQRRERIEELRTLDAQIKRAAREATQRLELEQLKAVSPELTALLAKRDEMLRPADAIHAGSITAG